MSNSATLDLPDGQWYRYSKRPSHGQVKAITRKLYEVLGTPDLLDIQTETVLVLGDTWLVKDDEGHDIPWGREGIASAPQDIVSDCMDACGEALNVASPGLGNEIAQRVPRTGGKAKSAPKP